MKILTKEINGNYLLGSQYLFVLLDAKSLAIFTAGMDKTGVEMDKKHLKDLIEDLTEILNMMG